jgi:hypothetical protein
MPLLPDAITRGLAPAGGALPSAAPPPSPPLPLAPLVVHGIDVTAQPNVPQRVDLPTASGGALSLGLRMLDAPVGGVALAWLTVYADVGDGWLRVGAAHVLVGDGGGMARPTLGERVVLVANVPGAVRWSVEIVFQLFTPVRARLVYGTSPAPVGAPGVTPLLTPHERVGATTVYGADVAVLTRWSDVAVLPSGFSVPGGLIELSGFSNDPVDRYVLLVRKATGAPIANGDTPVYAMKVPANAVWFSASFPENAPFTAPPDMTLWAVVSDTPNIVTLPAPASGLFSFSYRSVIQ